MNAVITKWGRVSTDGTLVTYDLTGTVDGAPFRSVITFETDGNYADVEHVSGLHIDVDSNQDAWDAIMVAMGENPSLNADMTV